MRIRLGFGTDEEDAWTDTILMCRMNGRALPESTVVKTLEQEADECYQSILLPINERMMGPLPQVLLPVCPP